MSLLKLSSTQLPVIPLYTFLSSQPIHSNFSVSFSQKHHYLHQRITCRRISHVTFGSGNEDTQTEFNVNTTIQEKEEVEEDEDEDEDDDEFVGDPDPQDLEYISQIKRVLELLKKNRDMLSSEVKLTIMIEDPREVERKRLIGIDDADTPTREELTDVLQEVQDGKIPRDRVALQLLAEEMLQWPNLEVEATKKGPRKSKYAKATDTGIDPEVAAKKLNIDWDSAAEIEEQDRSDESEVPSVVVGLHAEHGYSRSLARFAANMGPIVWKVASKKIEKALPPGVTFAPGVVGEPEASFPPTFFFTGESNLYPQGYGALYLVTPFPVIIGISVVLILFYNSLQ